MNIQVRHEAAGDGIRKYITQEFEKLQEKYEGTLEHATRSEFILDHEGTNGHRKVFEAIIHIPHEVFTIKESSDEPHKAIDATFRTLDKRLNKYKETYLRPGAKIRHTAAQSNGSTEAMLENGSSETDTEEA